MHLQISTYPKKAEEKRKPLRVDEIMLIQKTCLEIADERRLLLALISDTGMRLSEALGLVWGDVDLEHEHPHINLVPHLWRPLKTSGSKRLVPLVGVALTAIKLMHQQGLTPSFCSHRIQMLNVAMATQLQPL